MSREADFSPTTKTLLAERAGNHCSFPNCYAPTDGPSDESKSSSSSTGMACHIIAASDGAAARRVAPHNAMELKDPSNGIWMCYTHGKLIDTDECQYSIELLKKWKEIAELRAQLAQQFGWSKKFDPKLFSGIKLPSHSTQMSGLPNLNAIIGAAIHDCCAAVLWGREQADSTRDAVIEIARNAFVHGGASEVHLEITPLSIKLIDDGKPFDPSTLRKNGGKSGGSFALEHLFSDFHQSLYFSWGQVDSRNLNEISFVRSSEDIIALTPCTIEVGIADLRDHAPQFQIVEECHTVYVIFPDFVSTSDVFLLPKLINGRLPKGKDYVFVGRGLSKRSVGLLEELLPGIRIVNFDYEP